MAELTGKKAIVIGSTSGIGKGTAKELAACGAKVIVTGRRADRGEEVVQEILEAGGWAKFIALDVCDFDAYDGFVTAAADALGGAIDILHYNSGVAGGLGCSNIDVFDGVEWDRVMHTNLKGAMLMTNKVMPYLKESKGCIVYTTSRAAVNPTTSARDMAYGVSKAGLVYMMQAVAIQASKYGVRVNGVCPGLIETDILKNAPEEVLKGLVEEIPLKFIGQPSDIAKTVAFLASDDARFITGQNINVCGGASIS